MPRGIERARETERRFATSHTGLDFRSPRVIGSHVVGAGAEVAILALPVDPDDVAPMRDPVTGQAYFIAGISDPDGDDLLI